LLYFKVLFVFVTFTSISEIDNKLAPDESVDKMIKIGHIMNDN